MFQGRAIDIAKYTEEDLANGIPDKDFLSKEINEDLQLYNPLDLKSEDLINQAKELEGIGITCNKRINRSDGASISLAKYNFILANTHGFNQGYKTTRYNKSLSLIGNIKQDMQTDYWFSSSRSFDGLDSNIDIANKAIDRTIRRLNRGSIKGGDYPVIFESSISGSIIGNFLSSISGNNLFRQLSFLNNSINTQIFPDWFNISEDPFILKGLASCYFDGEGVAVAAKKIVDAGVVKEYLLSSYTARKMNMQPNGHAGGTHNIQVSHNTTNSTEELARKMVKGLIIIETIGHGLNMVNGDYSVGASGIWVENGELQYFVDNITIAGNLKTIFKNIIYVNNDYTNSSLLCGSMLVDGISVST